MIWPFLITKALNIAYPIIQAPMLGLTSPQMVAAISNCGGLGSLPVGGLSPEQTLQLLRQTKALTSRPFAVNLFAHDVPAYDVQQAELMQDFLENLATENQLTFERKEVSSFKFNTYQNQIEVLLQEQIPVVSFTFGLIDNESIKALKSKGTIIAGTATCLEEALLLDDKGIDIICAQGIEAGGHRGTFLDIEPLPQVTLLALVTQIIDHIKKPVIAAGGIADGKTIRAAFALGAAAVQIGTAFIASPESLAIPAYKKALKTAKDTDTVLTRAFSGRWARGLKNKMLTQVENSGIEIPSYPMHNSLTAAIRTLAQQQNNNQFTSMWAGQCANKAEALSCRDIFYNLIKETEQYLPYR